MSVEVANESGDEVDEGRLVSLCRHVLARLRMHPLSELSVLVVDEDTMAKLHLKWMDAPGPTDVLAFPMDELRSTRDDTTSEPGLLGDVVLCPRVAAGQAESAGHSTGAELDLLCTHGILHLLGYDHAEADGEREMFELQAELLRTWPENPEPAAREDPR